MVDWGDIIGNCTAIGIGPQEAKSLVLWEYQAAIRGWVKANTTEEQRLEAPTEEEAKAAFLKLAQQAE